MNELTGWHGRISRRESPSPIHRGSPPAQEASRAFESLGANNLRLRAPGFGRNSRAGQRGSVQAVDA
eukprot:4646749-Prymnesium_polylepis.1